ncbi:hypothetical protein EVAR_27306_1 [Eumeta japonica]|uniref:Uncharacterized protein n=1 Tax=Eumeta variegata TaxID=151549 RepID=A0A4C1UC70_EUMVA|nr:hypothetical protein EVAR_27306_1 [Eumeta japonica]
MCSIGDVRQWNVYVVASDVVHCASFKSAGFLRIGGRSRVASSIGRQEQRSDIIDRKPIVSVNNHRKRSAPRMHSTAFERLPSKSIAYVNVIRASSGLWKISVDDIDNVPMFSAPD